MDSFDIMLYVGYALVGIAAVVAVLLPLIKSLDDPKSLFKTGLAIVGVLVLFFICYSISSNEVLPKFEGAPFFLTPQMSQVVGGSLLTTYVLAVIALGSIFVTEITKGLK
jgi:NADH:ubiquinone oxidoreductase subunit 6 (subunit J)